MPRILGEIQERFAKRQPLNITAVKRECPELIESLYHPQAFVGWRKALEQAGVDYSKINVDLSETVECLLCGNEYKSFGAHLQKIHDYTTNDYLQEFPGAEMVSEQFRARSAHFFRRSRRQRPARSVIPHWEPLWSREYALDRLARLYELGHPISSRHLYNVEAGLSRHLYKTFGTYDQAVEAIGLNAAEIRLVPPGISWSREKVLEAFRKRLRDGKSLAYYPVQREFSGLASAALSYFGSYKTAIEALGINYEKEVKIPPRRIHTSSRRHEILREAKRLAAQPKYDWQAVDAFQKKYLRGIERLFRNLRGLAAEAGIPVERILRDPNRPLERKAVLKALRRRHEAGLSVQYTELKKTERKLFRSIYRHFGTLREAIHDAGIVLPPRPLSSKYKDPHAVIEAILRSKAKKQPLNFSSLKAGKRSRPNDTVYRWACRHFGSWKKALLAAGLDPLKEVPRRVLSEHYPTQEAVVAGIRKRKAEGRSLKRVAVLAPHRLGGDKGFHQIAVRHFGSWDKALAAAGLDPDRESPWRCWTYPSAKLVIEAIRLRHQKGLGLNARCLHRKISEGGDTTLYARGKKFFGSWDKALAAALASQNA